MVTPYPLDYRHCCRNMVTKILYAIHSQKSKTALIYCTLNHFATNHYGYGVEHTRTSIFVLLRVRKQHSKDRSRQVAQSESRLWPAPAAGCDRVFHNSVKSRPMHRSAHTDRRRVLHDLQQRDAQLHCGAHRPLPTGAERERVARSGNRQCVIYTNTVH